MTSSTGAPLYNWLTERSAGVLLHVSSLPSETGIGNFGTSTYRFLDFLKSSGVKIWQLCPLGPTGYGDSPYQCFSAFAGNPYFIDLEPLLNEGLITNEEFQLLRLLPKDSVNYANLYTYFWPALEAAYQRFADSGADEFLDYGSLSEFKSKQSFWLEDYALYMSFKAEFDGKCWVDWPATYRDHAKAIKKKRTKKLQAAIDAQIFYQYLFFAQLAKVREYAHSLGIEILGDMPIFVSLDSSDVWVNRELFQLKANGKPSAVAGVPPDYFSADGQLWGNPLYDWEAHQKTDFSWWVQRVRSNLEFYDIVRLDHFRGFESYWSVPADHKTARNGEWMPCPGLELFQAIKTACPDAKLIAEDLGVITDEVLALREASGMPGMVVLQFAFGGDADNAYLPHNYSENAVVYSGTHDNDTTLGWYQNLDMKAQDHLRRYLSVSGEHIAWDLVRAALKSTARMAVVPLQDLMNLGSEARFNSPGVAMGNWQWRYTPAQLDQLQNQSGAYLKEQIELFGRS